MRKYLGKDFICKLGMARPVTTAELRTRNRQRRELGHGHEGSLAAAIEELADIENGAEFELPAHYNDCAGTKWKLLRVYYEDRTGRYLGTYAPLEEAANIPQEVLFIIPPTLESGRKMRAGSMQLPSL
jgi:hypothetical protein